MELYIQGKDHGWIILNSVVNGPLVWPTVVQEDGNVRLKIYEELSDKEKLHVDCDLKATNIVLQGLPPDVYSLVNHHKVAKDIWDRVKLLMQGTSLLKQEHECKLYDEFDKFSHVKGETLHQYYLSLPPEYGKFVTDVKLARDLHTSNYDHLYAYLEQQEAHANEARLMRKIFPCPLALVANYHQPQSHFNNYHSQYTTLQYQQQFSPLTQHVYSSPPQSNPYGAPHHSQQYPTAYPTNLSHTQPSVTKNAYLPLTIPQQPQAEFPQLDSCHVVPTFLSGIKPLFKMVKLPLNKFKEDKVKMLSVQEHKVMLQVHETITHNAAFQTDDLDYYDSDCDDISSAKAVLMASLSSCDSDVLSEIDAVRKTDIAAEVTKEIALSS
uniref:Integrase, catalytic region, zinc finger, CCHC-type, peptidase aspartic, catalytic n=1 Tax=Tanacetum cinerariifolium TaxID=118510 RepID=A0A6L2MM04_TANCI|nr:hypothetical protein [Tanacetum cinerariifolium]